MAEQLQQIYDNLGRPGAEALRFRARRQGINITVKEAQYFVKKQSIGQVFTGRLVSDGKVPGGARDNDKAQCDLVDMSKFSRENNGFKWIITCIDTFSKKAWAFKMRDKSGISITNAMKVLLLHGCQIALVSEGALVCPRFALVFIKCPRKSEGIILN